MLIIVLINIYADYYTDNQRYTNNQYPIYKGLFRDTKSFINMRLL